MNSEDKPTLAQMREFLKPYLWDEDFHAGATEFANAQYFLYSKAATFRARTALVLDRKFIDPPSENPEFSKLNRMLNTKLTVDEQAALYRATPNELRATFVRLKLSES